MSGRHVLVDWWVEDRSPLERSAHLREDFRDVLERSGHTVVGELYHDFEPAGFTGVILLSESHLAVHTWIDQGLITLDLFTCVDAPLEPIIEDLRDIVGPCQQRVTSLQRGGSREEPCPLRDEEGVIR